jgi:hypothetical protein
MGRDPSQFKDEASKVNALQFVNEEDEGGEQNRQNEFSAYFHQFDVETQQDVKFDKDDTCDSEAKTYVSIR